MARRMSESAIREHLPNSILAKYQQSEFAQIVRASTHPQTDDITLTMEDGSKHKWALERGGWKLTKEIR